MGNMTAMELRRGLEGVDIGASTDRVLGMAMAFTGFTLGMFMLGSGQMGRAMDVEFTPVKMGADMLGNSSGVSNMGLAITISGNFCRRKILLMYFFI